MPLNFHPNPGTIVICDYSTGFIAPEMVKARPVVALSPRRRTGQLVTVVPLSSTEPMPVEPWHVPLPSTAYPPARGPMWVKADMIATIALTRLDRVKVKGPGGIRTYQTFQVDAACLAAIRAAVKRRWPSLEISGAKTYLAFVPAPRFRPRRACKTRKGRF